MVCQKAAPIWLPCPNQCEFFMLFVPVVRGRRICHLRTDRFEDEPRGKEKKGQLRFSNTAFINVVSARLSSRLVRWACTSWPGSARRGTKSGARHGNASRRGSPRQTERLDSQSHAFYRLLVDDDKSSEAGKRIMMERITRARRSFTVRQKGVMYGNKRGLSRGGRC